MRSVEMIDARLVALARERAFDLRTESPETAELLERLARYAEESRADTDEALAAHEECFDSGPSVLEEFEDAVKDMTAALEKARSLVGLA